MIEEQSEQASLSDVDLDEIVEQFRAAMDIRDRFYGFPKKLYPRCFAGNEAVLRLIRLNIANDKEDAQRIGNLLLSAGIFHHVQRAHEFRNEYLFYRFASDEDHGSIETRSLSENREPTAEKLDLARFPDNFR